MSTAKDHVGKFRVNVKRTYLSGSPKAGQQETITKWFSDEQVARDFSAKARKHSSCLLGFPVKDVPQGVEHILAAN